MLTLSRLSVCAIAACAVVLVLLPACSTSTSTPGAVAANADAGDARDGRGDCCTPETSQCGPREADGACNRCCHGDACGFPPDADGTCRGPVNISTCPGAAPTKADLDQSGGWKPPAAAQTACSASDISTFEANFKVATYYSDLIKGLPAACGSCILGKETDATWAFVVTDDKGELGFLNYGACYARAGGGSDACGKAVQYSKFCINASCSDCYSASESVACLKDLDMLMACSANFEADIQADCGGTPDQAKRRALDEACGTATLAVGVLCGTQ